MKLKIILLILMILSIVFVGCDKDDIIEPEIPINELEAARKAIVQHQDNTMPINVDSVLNLGNSIVDGLFPEIGIIVIKKQRQEEDYQYSAVKLNGDVILGYSDNEQDDYINIKIDNNIIIAKNRQELFTVKNLEGDNILVNYDAVNIVSFGDHHFGAELSTGRTKVYTIKGNNVFKVAQTYPFNNEIIFSCGESYILNRDNLGYHYIFNNNGNSLKFFRDTDSVKHNINYLGEDRFVIVRNTTVTANDDYDVFVNDKYITQEIIIFNAKTSNEEIIELDYVVSGLGNSYTSFQLKSVLNYGYSFMSVYNRNSDRSVNPNTPLLPYIINSNFNIVVEYEMGVYPFISFKNDKGIENISMDIKLRMISINGQILWEKPEENVSTILGFNEDIIITGKITNNTVLYGAFDNQGTKIIDYQYNTLSVFTGGYAIGESDGQFFRIDINNNRTLIDKEVIASNYFFGLYMTSENDYKLLYNNAGACLVSEEYKAKQIIVYNNITKTYLALTDEDDNLKIVTLS